MSLKRIVQHRILLPFYRRFRPEIPLNWKGHNIVVSARDGVIGRELYVEGSHDIELLQFIRTLDLRDKLCLDIGANIGLHSLMMSDAGGTVLAFEAEPYNFSLLKQNVSEASVTPHQVAVGSSERPLHMALNSWNFGDHRISDTGIEVKQITIDSLGLSDVGLIKIDVQGFEMEAFRGMVETLERSPDVILCNEVMPGGLKEHGSSGVEMVKFLRDLGFDGWEIEVRRIVPILEPEAYELFNPTFGVNMVLARDKECLKPVLRTFGYPI